jgi:hypothetical protein
MLRLRRLRQLPSALRRRHLRCGAASASYSLRTNVVRQDLQKDLQYFQLLDWRTVWYHILALELEDKTTRREVCW